MHLEPAALYRELEARAVFGRAAAVTEEKRLVDFLDVDAALNWLDRVGDLEDPARGFLSERISMRMPSKSHRSPIGVPRHGLRMSTFPC